MFTQSCFIRKNTPRLRKKLEELGYTNGAWESPHFEYPYLKCFPNRKFGLFKGDGFYMTEDDYRLDDKVWTYNPPKEYIDCETNEELFLALAALRDDSDYMQWFVSQTEKDSPKVFIKSTTHSCTQSLAYTHRWDWRCSKATIKEIIEHFKDS